MDAGNSPDLSDRNTVIYGHNMKNRTMFGSLKKFIQEEGMADGNPWFYLYTEDKAVRYRIISYYTTVSGSDTYQSVYTDEDYDSYLDMILRKSLLKDIRKRPRREGRIWLRCPPATEKPAARGGLSCMAWLMKSGS